MSYIVLMLFINKCPLLSVKAAGIYFNIRLCELYL